MNMRQIINLLEAAPADPARADLENHFNDMSNFPDEDSEDDGWQFPDGSRSVECTNWMRYAYRLLGARVQFYGFFEDDNPDSQIAQEAGGHDFAVVDGRYIVDGWLKHVAGMHRTAVLDLQDPSEQPLIARLYGPQENWQHDAEGIKKELDNEPADVRAAAMRGVALFKGGQS